MALITSYAHPLRRTRWFTVSSGITAGLFSLCALTFKPSNLPLPQILDTLWFELHVVLAFFSYALFVVGGAVLCSVSDAGGTGLPGCRVQDRSARLVVLFDFDGDGGIWGYYAWGTYWLWTPKELWTSILWLFCALVLHMRLKGERWDRPAAWLGVAGVVVMLFTYLGVSMLMKSSHRFLIQIR
jgi:ABC-type transport system involved in cytochrome c biogenesis permease subunit